MGKLNVSLTHILLFAITVFLFLNWLQLRATNKALVSMDKTFHSIDADLTQPFDVNVTQ